jgi:hypothetical protein
MINFAKINLPEPSYQLLAMFDCYCKNTVLDPDKKRWLDEFHKNQINSVLHLFELNECLQPLIQKEYQDLFPKHDILCVTGIMKNKNIKINACLPPHVDRSRALGINYIVELGGSAVETVFYNHEEEPGGEAKNKKYNELNPVDSIKATKGWYVYHTQRYHSVENIETTRTMIAIMLKQKNTANDSKIFDYSINDFCKDYPHLLC